MIKHSYFIDKKDGNRPTKVYFNCQISSGNENRLKYSIGEEVAPSDWDAKNFRTVKNRLSNANITISRVDGMMTNINTDISNGGEPPTKGSLRLKLDDLLGRKPKAEKKTFGFFDMWDGITNDRENGEELNDGQVFSDNTVIGYKNTKKALEIYERDKRAKLDMATFSVSDYTDLHNYLTMLPNYNKSSVGFHLKNLKTFIKAAHTRGWHKNLVFREPAFKIPVEKPIKIDLSMEVLDKMDSMKLHGNEAITRDWFLIEAMTGIRVGDTLKLTAENIIGGNIVNKAQKNKKETTMPISQIVRNVLERNNGSFPPQIPYRYYADAIKQVAEMTGMLDANILVSETRKGKIVKKFVPQHRVVTSHTARRSTVGNLRRAGVDADDRTTLIGMTAETMKGYDKVTGKEVAQKVAGNSFFK